MTAQPTFEQLESALAEIMAVCEQNGKDPLETIVDFIRRRIPGADLTGSSTEAPPKLADGLVNDLKACGVDE